MSQIELERPRIDADKHRVAWPDDSHKPRSSGFKNYLSFYAAGQNCALESHQVRGIVPGAGLLSLSGLTDHSLEIAGLCEFQGRELVVVDLAKCLGVPAQSGQATLVVAGVDVTSFGFMVQRVSAVQKYHQRNIRDGWLTGQGRRRRLIDWRALGIAAILRDFARCRS